MLTQLDKGRSWYPMLPDTIQPSHKHCDTFEKLKPDIGSNDNLKIEKWEKPETPETIVDKVKELLQ